jgi:hypothetical protein
MKLDLLIASRSQNLLGRPSWQCRAVLSGLSRPVTNTVGAASSLPVGQERPGPPTGREDQPTLGSPRDVQDRLQASEPGLEAFRGRASKLRKPRSIRPTTARYRQASNISGTLLQSISLALTREPVPPTRKTRPPTEAVYSFCSAFASSWSMRLSSS